MKVINDIKRRTIEAILKEADNRGFKCNVFQSTEGVRFCTRSDHAPAEYGLYISDIQMGENNNWLVIELADRNGNLQGDFLIQYDELSKFKVTTLGRYAKITHKSGLSLEIEAEGYHWSKLNIYPYDPNDEFYLMVHKGEGFYELTKEVWSSRSEDAYNSLRNRDIEFWHNESMAIVMDVARQKGIEFDRIGIKF